jgi:2-polyprenyl-3-methyl-5-hydroxy-6-metoxy-1,4-benzoquinol methylase
MICRICNSNTKHAFTEKVLNKYDVKYFKCDNCRYLFTEEPYWLNEAYLKSINISDTGLINRNVEFSKILSVLIYFNFDKDAKFLDYAGGYGVFTRLMRDVGFDFYWQDTYTQNLFAQGCDYHSEMKIKFELLTAFEVFEHFINPKEELSKMLQLSNTIVFSTELLSSEIPDPKSWWYYGFNHGQHIGFYSQKTLTELAQFFRLNYYSISNVHFFTKHRISSLKLFLNKFRNYGLYKIVKRNMTSRINSDFTKLNEL